MNRRFRAGELGLAEVERNLAPWQPHVDKTSSGDADAVSASHRRSPGESNVDGVGGEHDRVRVSGSVVSNDRGIRSVSRGLPPTPPTSSVEGIASESRSSRAKDSRELLTDAPSTEVQRAQMVDALHSYIVAACGYDHGRALTILNRVLTTLDNQLAPVGRAEQDRHQ